MQIVKLATPLLAVLGLAACQQTPTYDTVSTLHSQRLMPDNSMLGEACDGHDATAMLRLKGRNLLYVSARVVEIIGGREVPYGVAAAPADFGVSQLPRPVYSANGANGNLSCGGLALKTRVDTDGSTYNVAFDLEIAPQTGLGGERLPADPYRIRSVFGVNLNGAGSERVGFTMAGRPFVAYMTAAPAPEWERDRTVKAARGIVDSVYRSYGTPLPDELPNRTLRDVTNPNYLK